MGEGDSWAKAMLRIAKTIKIEAYFFFILL